MGVGITEGSLHFYCEGLLASEEALEFETESIWGRLEETPLRYSRSLAVNLLFSEHLKHLLYNLFGLGWFILCLKSCFLVWIGRLLS
jgi:hypothetical protein